MVQISQLKLLKDLFIQPRKSLGQNFIVKEEILDKIVEACNLQDKDTVIEIGAGLGGLTSRLASRVKKVLAIEKDGQLAHLLRTRIIRQSKVKIIHQDALHFDFELAALEAGHPLKVVGNLPFNIASRLTIELLKKRGSLESMVLMYQKEVAERIMALPGNKNYGFLTIMANLYADTEILLSVGKEAFYPRPKVESTVIKYNILPCPRERLENENYFSIVVKSAFSQRRKKLRNSLKSIKGAGLSADLIERICRETGIDPNRRGETLSLKEFAFLSNQLLLVIENNNPLIN